MGWAWVEVLLHGYPTDIHLACGTYMLVRHEIFPRPRCPSLEGKITKDPLSLTCNPRLSLISWHPLSLPHTLLGRAWPATLPTTSPVDRLSFT
jgi:hypothetical protein